MTPRRVPIGGGSTETLPRKRSHASEVTFDELISWTKRLEKGIQYYSGTATYSVEFKLTAADLQQTLWLDLGRLRELAEVRVNGKSLGIVWAPPFRVALGDVIRSGSNRLEVDVVNFWPNRIIGDQFLPPAQQLTKTNIRRFKQSSPLIESGLFGPVVLLRESED